MSGDSLRVRAFGIQLLSLAAFLLLWEGAARLGGVDPDVLPAASDVFATLWHLKNDASFRAHAGITAARVGIAFAIGAPLALAVGFLIGDSQRMTQRFEPALNVLLGLPQSMLLPLFILALGVGHAQKVVFGITHLFFVMVQTTIAAVQSVPREYVEATRSFGASRWRIYRSIHLPAMLPVLVGGLRIGMIFNVLGVLLAETYASQDGIGLLIMQWGEAYKVKSLMAAILLISIVTIAFNEFMRAAEARLATGMTDGIRT